MTPEERGQWIAEALLPAIREAGRPVEINYRIPHSANKGSGGSTSRESELLGRRLLEAVDMPGPIWSEVKYNWSHGHSTPKLCIIHGGRPTDALWNPPAAKYRLTWMVRNEDFFCLRWCGPTSLRPYRPERSAVDGRLLHRVGVLYPGEELHRPTGSGHGSPLGVRAPTAVLPGMGAVAL